jgi:ABC-type multidrug transport system fused ATPase/permease subunit
MLATSFGEFIWLIIISFFFISYLMLFFSVVSDLFRDHELGGAAKAIWVILLLIFPFLALLAYLIVRGGGMAKRASAQQAAAKQEFDSYVRQTAGVSPATELANAKSLVDSGAISAAEYEQLKAKILS